MAGQPLQLQQPPQQQLPRPHQMVGHMHRGGNFREQVDVPKTTSGSAAGSAAKGAAGSAAVGAAESAAGGAAGSKSVAEYASESKVQLEAEIADDLNIESVAEVEDIAANEIEERRRLEQLDPGSMLVTELKKALKFEFPSAPKSGTKNELKDRSTVFRNAAKHHPATVYETDITDEELKGWL